MINLQRLINFTTKLWKEMSSQSPQIKERLTRWGRNQLSTFESPSSQIFISVLHQRSSILFKPIKEVDGLLSMTLVASSLQQVVMMASSKFLTPSTEGKCTTLTSNMQSILLHFPQIASWFVDAAFQRTLKSIAFRLSVKTTQWRATQTRSTPVSSVILRSVS